MELNIPQDYRQAREHAGLSQATVSRRTGYSRTHVINVEAGRANPSSTYTQLFREAVDPSYSEPAPEQAVLEIPSLNRMRKSVANSGDEVSSAHRQLSRLKAELDVTMRGISNAIGAVSNIVEQSTRIAQSAASSPNPYYFDPTTASDEDTEAVAQYICSVILELFTEHNFDRLSEAQLETYLNRYTNHIKVEMAKLRARGKAVR